MTNIKEHLNYWNDFMLKWNEDHEALYNDSIWKNASEFEPAAVPEPYLGDPVECDIITLNLNPGPVISDLQMKPNGKFIQEIGNQTYYKWAKEFPYLKFYEKSAGGKWWTTRSKWLGRIAGIPSDNINILGIEICPWHSHSWRGVPKKVQFEKYFEKRIVGFCAAVSPRFPIVVTVGADFARLFEQMGFELVSSVEPNSDYPLNSKGNPICRWYSIYRDKTGPYYLNTYSRGSNNAPSANFQEIEQDLIKNILSVRMSKTKKSLHSAYSLGDLRERVLGLLKFPN